MVGVVTFFTLNPQRAAFSVDALICTGYIAEAPTARGGTGGSFVSVG